jgi:Coenzyme PQQ synthesis protein D (PqqD)
MQIEKASPTVFTQLDDGTGVLLNLNTLFYYSLNRTGTVLWQQIEEHRAITLDELLRGTHERFEVSEDALRSHIIKFIEQLENLKMVRIS